MWRGKGRGGGRGGKRGPRLPNTLQDELNDQEHGPGSRGGRPPSRKERRKEERHTKRGGAVRGGYGGHPACMGLQPRQQHMAHGRSMDEDLDSGDALEHPAQKRQRTEEKGREGSGRDGHAGHGSSKFADLLPAHLQKAGGYDPELELQRELAKKMGLKRGEGIGGDDGLDELLADLGGLDELFDKEETLQANARAPGGKIKKAAAQHEEQPWRQAEISDSEGEEEGAPSEEEEEGSGSEGLSEDDDLGEIGLLESGEDEEAEEGLDEEEQEDLGQEEEEKVWEKQQGGEERQQGDSEGSEQLSGSGSDGQLSDLDVLGSGASSGEEDGQEDGEEEEDKEAGTGSEDASGSGSDREPARQRQRPAPAEAANPTERYVPPAARRAAAAAAAASAGAAQGEEERVARRVRGLLNRIAESNLQGIVGQLAELFQEEGRRGVSDAVCSELLGAAAEGPRASDKFAAVAAAVVAGLAGSVGAAEVAANFISRLGSRAEEAVEAGDSLSCHNLAMVAAQLYLAGAMRADLTYNLLNFWCQRLSEVDVSMLSALLRTCGWALRADDPQAMRDFVVALHARAAELGRAGALSKRAQMMLELVVDIKNNRKRESSGASGGGGGAALAPTVAKWLKSCGVREMAVGGITWDKVLQPDKRGIWWRPEAGDALAPQRGSGGKLAAAAADAAGGGADMDGGLTAPELLRLAAAQRMNTDARRAVFCMIMGSSDCVDAFEKLLRLNLKGEQEREIVRVCVEVALQEAGYNPYYSLLLLRLANASKAHKVTLQFCFWDHLKELGGMEVRRLTNLARLAAALVAGRGLAVTALKAADFAGGGAAMAPREVLFWRVFFQHLLAGCKSTEDCASLFSRLAGYPTQQQLGTLRTGLRAFLQRSVGPWLASMGPAGTGVGKGPASRAGASSGSLSTEELTTTLRRLRAVERALSSASSGGVA